MMEWQPIETAPKDRNILVCEADGKVSVASHTLQHFPRAKPSWVGMCRDEFVFDEAEGMIWFEPTHWMPLPEPPT
jgi:hypothetical protein